MAKRTRAARQRGFSLIELVVVVVIIAIIGAVAVPRVSRGAQGATDSSLIASLKTLRNAIDLYAAEHGTYPTGPDQLTQFTDAAGATSLVKTASHIYGPYLQAIPALPVGGPAHKGSNTFVTAGTPGANPGAWHYESSTGEIKANLANGERDSAGKQYNRY